MMDYSGEYEFEMINYKNGDYVYPSTLSGIDDYLERYNLHEEWRNQMNNQIL